MDSRTDLKTRILNLKSHEFEAAALEVFHWQAAENPVYNSFLNHLPRFRLSEVRDIEQIPFLPIDFFRTQKVLMKGIEPKLVFESSGTTGSYSSKHYVADPDFYKAISSQIFEQAYGNLHQYQLLALLPSYLERGNSSLVYMAQHFIAQAREGSGFFLNNYSELKEALQHTTEKTLLIGVTFALLDFFEQYPSDCKDLIIMETGGMKGRRRELTREELHWQLMQKSGVKMIHGEYGMTELLSQFYSKGKGIFTRSNWAKILLRDITDPFSIEKRKLKNAGINIIDLANLDSCSFIATKDIGRIGDQETFQVMGRFDESDVRGCNLMVS